MNKSLQKSCKTESKGHIKIFKARKINMPIKDKNHHLNETVAHYVHSCPGITKGECMSVIYWIMIIFARNIVGTV